MIKVSITICGTEAVTELIPETTADRDLLDLAFGINKEATIKRNGTTKIATQVPQVAIGRAVVKGEGDHDERET